MMRKANVLLVDDEVAFVTGLSKLLTRRGYPVIAAHDGSSAIRLLEENDVDVVLLDLRMPGVDGIETLKELKSRRPEIQVIILTGHGDVDSAMDALKFGAFDFKSKPVDLADLIERIDKAFRRKVMREKRVSE